MYGLLVLLISTYSYITGTAGTQRVKMTPVYIGTHQGIEGPQSTCFMCVSLYNMYKDFPPDQQFVDQDWRLLELGHRMNI